MRRADPRTELSRPADPWAAATELAHGLRAWEITGQLLYRRAGQLRAVTDWPGAGHAYWSVRQPGPEQPLAQALSRGEPQHLRR
jgi:hypothetical protein